MTFQAIRLEDFVELEPSRGNVHPGDHGLAVTIERLRKSFGNSHVLRGLDLQIRAGEFVAVVGRSGCGKSTLLRLLIGLDHQSGGQIRFGDGCNQASRSGAVRIMFQEPRLLPWASVLANVEVGLGRQRSSSDAHKQALRTLHEVGLANKRDHWPLLLSGGQKQRVALARALVSGPRLLAFDEPLGALDALTRISMQRLIERVWLDQRFTAVMVTHDVAEAVTLADRILVIENGKIALDRRVALPRPRERGSPEVAALEGRILREFFADVDTSGGT